MNNTVWIGGKETGTPSMVIAAGMNGAMSNWTSGNAAMVSARATRSVHSAIHGTRPRYDVKLVVRGGVPIRRPPDWLRAGRVADDGTVTVLDSLDVPIVQAPMAGGVSTPELAAAVSEAGGLGFLAAGYLTVEALRQQIQQVRRLTARPFGVNLFVPGDSAADDDALARYRDRLEAEAALYGTELGEPVADDDGWAGKLAVVRETRVPVVSFTFGCPSPAAIASLKRFVATVIVTVTSAAEARLAAEAGADVLCVQGSEAGGHRGTFTNPEHVDDLGLIPLLRRVSAVTQRPLIAAGGLSTGRDVAAVLVAGAAAAQLGTVFLTCPESGANSVYKAALTDPSFPGTAVTRAFSGRPARGLVNRFMLDHSADAPAGYPQVHHLTRPLRAAAARAGDAAAMSLWAGQGHPFARDVPAAELTRALAEDARTALVEAVRRYAG